MALMTTFPKELERHLPDLIAQENPISSSTLPVRCFGY
jgi:hypothetical protein